MPAFASKASADTRSDTRSACIAGTGIETNINGQFKLTLHKQATLQPKLQDLDFALLENANEYVVHGLTVKVIATAIPAL